MPYKSNKVQYTDTIRTLTDRANGMMDSLQWVNERYINVHEFNASGSAQQTTVPASMPSTSVVPVANVMDFKPSQGIWVDGSKAYCVIKITSGATSTTSTYLQLSLDAFNNISDIQVNINTTAGDAPSVIAQKYLTAYSSSTYTNNPSSLFRIVSVSGDTMIFVTKDTKRFPNFQGAYSYNSLSGVGYSTQSYYQGTDPSVNAVASVDTVANTVTLQTPLPYVISYTSGVHNVYPINVKHDDTNAIQNAINSAVTNSIQEIFLPPGTYNDTSALTNIDKVSFIGDSVTFMSGLYHANSLTSTKTLVGDSTKLATGSLVGDIVQNSNQTRTLSNITGISVDNFSRLSTETDDTGKLQRAFNSLQAGDILIFPYGKTYTISQSLIFPIVNNVTIFGYGATIDASKVPTGNALINASGTLASSISVATDIVLASTTVQLSSTSGLAAGNMILIADTSLFNQQRTDYKKGEIQFIQSVDSTTQITLENATFDNYAVANSAAVTLITPIQNLTIKGLTIIGGGTGSQHQGLLVQCAFRPLIEDCQIYNSEVTAFSLSQCYAPILKKNYAKGSNDANTGYGVVVSSGSRDYTVEGNVMTKCRHGFTTGGNSVVRFGSVKDNHVSNCFRAGIDTHGDTEFITIEGNTIVECEGMQIRGHYTTVKNNQILSSFGNGIQTGEEGGFHLTIEGNEVKGSVYAISLTSGTATRVQIRGNDLSYATSAIWLDASVTGIEHVKITGNTITKMHRDGISVGGHSNILITDNDISDCGLDYPNQPSSNCAIDLLNPSTGTSGNIIIKNNQIFNVSTLYMYTGIRIGSAYNNIKVKGNQIFNVTSHFENNSTDATIEAILDENEGNTYIPSGSTYVTINHGLNGTPTKLYLTTYGNVGTPFVNNLSSTTFRANLPTAPASNATIYWRASL